MELVQNEIANGKDAFTIGGLLQMLQRGQELTSSISDATLGDILKRWFSKAALLTKSGHSPLEWIEMIKKFWERHTSKFESLSETSERLNNIVNYSLEYCRTLFNPKKLNLEEVDLENQMAENRYQSTDAGNDDDGSVRDCKIITDNLGTDQEFGIVMPKLRKLSANIRARQHFKTLSKISDYFGGIFTKTVPNQTISRNLLTDQFLHTLMRKESKSDLLLPGDTAMGIEVPKAKMIQSLKPSKVSRLPNFSLDTNDAPTNLTMQRKNKKKTTIRLGGSITPFGGKLDNIFAKEASNPSSGIKF